MRKKHEKKKTRNKVLGEKREDNKTEGQKDKVRQI